MKDDIIRSNEDLRKALDDAGLKHIPIFDLSDEEFPPRVDLKDVEKRKEENGK